MKKNFLLLLALVAVQLCFSQTPDSTFFAPDLSRVNLTSPVRFSIKQLYVPGSLIITGVAINSNKPEAIKYKIVGKRNEYLPNFATHIDDNLQYTPIIIAYGLDIFAVKSKTDIQNRTIILLKGQIAMEVATGLLKKTTHVERPDHSDFFSFPSGHTAQAFASATFLNEEYKDKLPWIPYLSYSIATSVGILRIANNKHYMSDVLVGAGIGILSMKLSYWTHQYKWGKRKMR